MKPDALPLRKPPEPAHSQKPPNGLDDILSKRPTREEIDEAEPPDD